MTTFVKKKKLDNAPSPLENISLFEQIDYVAKKINGGVELSETWKKIFKENEYGEKLSVIEEIPSKTWVELGLPMRLLIELRKAQKEKKIETSKLPLANETEEVLVTARERFRDTLNLIDRKKSKQALRNIISTDKRDKEIKLEKAIHNFNANHHNITGVNLSSNNKRDVIEIAVNIVGAEALSTQFIKSTSLYFSALKGVGKGNTKLIYNENAKFQFFSCSGIAENDCTVIIFVFSITQPHTLYYLQNSIQKHIPNLEKKKCIDLPIVLIGIDACDRESALAEGKEVVSEDDVKLAIKSLKSTTYLEISSKNNDQISSAIEAAGKAGLKYIEMKENTKNSVISSEIYRTCEFENNELALKKRMLKFVPNSILFLNQLQLLRLSNNLISFFPKELKVLVNLMELDLSNNLIEVVEAEDIIEFKSLVKLNLENNRLETVPTSDQLKNANSLLEFRVKGNPLSSLPSSRIRKSQS